MSVDRREKHRLERLAQAARVPSDACQAGDHAACSGIRIVGYAGDGIIEGKCGCRCHG